MRPINSPDSTHPAPSREGAEIFGTCLLFYSSTLRRRETDKNSNDWPQIIAAPLLPPLVCAAQQLILLT